MTSSGSDYDDDGNYFTYTYTWGKNEVYCTQGQLDQAVSDLNQTLSERNQTISDLNDTIAQKDQTISALSDLDGDGILDLKDIIWGLQVLTGQR